MDFAEKFVSFRDKLEQTQDKAYKSQKNVMVEGRPVPLYSVLNINSERKMFGIMKMGSVGHAHDFRFLFSEPKLTEEKLIEYFEYGKKIEETAVEADKGHDFSMITIVLFCGQIDSAAAKAIKKANAEKKYASGWSSVRIGMVDLSTGKIFTNRLGDVVKDIIKSAL